MFNLEKHFLRGEVVDEPFQHMVVENALPQEMYEELLNARPSWESIAPRNWQPNSRYDLHARQVVSGVWKLFVEEATSGKFWEAIKHKFRLNIPGKVGVRGIHDTPIVMDCNIGINTPGKGRVRGPHTDNPKEIWAALWYMGTGGGADLELCKAIKPLRRWGKAEIYDDCVETVKTVKYNHNTLVSFVAKDAIHAVTERTVEEPRYLVNIIAEYR
jgi:hypothetical protein